MAPLPWVTAAALADMMSLTMGGFLCEPGTPDFPRSWTGPKKARPSVAQPCTPEGARPVHACDSASRLVLDACYAVGRLGMSHVERAIDARFTTGGLHAACIHTSAAH